MRKCALVTGICGQDGFYLSKVLIDNGYSIVGTTHRSGVVSSRNISKEIFVENWDLLDRNHFLSLIKKYKPSVIFNLASMSSGVGMNSDPVKIGLINGFSVLDMLETVRKNAPTTQFVQASSAEVFGAAKSSPQSEISCRAPRSAYGAAKVFADSMVKLYREEFGMYCSSAILYNHESPHRGEGFVTRKITRAVAAIKCGKGSQLLLGNLDAERDWGHARDYAGAMWRMSQAQRPNDYIIATGQVRKVREFVEVAFGEVGITLRWEGKGAAERGYCGDTGVQHVGVSPTYYRPVESSVLVGDPARARADLGWVCQTSFRELISEMVSADVACFDAN